MAVSDALIASDRTRFGVTEINVGLLGAGGHIDCVWCPWTPRESWSGAMPDVVGEGAFAEMLFTKC